MSLSQQSCLVSRRLWVEHLHHLCSTLSAASHTIYPACLISAHQPSWWKDDQAHLCDHGGTRNTDSQKQASTPVPTSNLCPALYFHRQSLKWSGLISRELLEFIGVAVRQKQVGTEDKCYHPPQFIPVKAQANKCGSRHWKCWSYISITSSIYKLLAHPSDWHTGSSGWTDIKEGKALMTHHVYSWTAVCQNASRFSHTPNLQLAPKPPQHWFSEDNRDFQAGSVLFFLWTHPKKRQGNRALTFACPNSGLLYSEKLTLPSLNFIYPLTCRNFLSPHLRRDREEAILNCLLFPSGKKLCFFSAHKTNKFCKLLQKLWKRRSPKLVETKAEAITPLCRIQAATTAPLCGPALLAQKVKQKCLSSSTTTTKKLFWEMAIFCKYDPGQPSPLPLSTTPSSRKNAEGRKRINHSQRTTQTEKDP